MESIARDFKGKLPQLVFLLMDKADRKLTGDCANDSAAKGPNSHMLADNWNRAIKLERCAGE